MKNVNKRLIEIFNIHIKHINNLGKVKNCIILLKYLGIVPFRDNASYGVFRRIFKVDF